MKKRIKKSDMIFQILMIAAFLTMVGLYVASRQQAKKLEIELTTKI